MFALVVFTAMAVFFVVGYLFSLYAFRFQEHAAEILVKRFNIPEVALNKLADEASLQAEQNFNLDFLSVTESTFLFGLIFLTLALPSMLAWWLSRRFARPLTNLSKAAHRITSGDFLARVPMTKSLERREDETALLLKDFNQMAASLERLEHERRYSLAAIAHELRTPVTVLRGRLEGVRDGVIAANQNELEKLIGHADLLSKLIEDLQLLSLAEAGELELERKDFVIQDLLQRIHGDYLVKAQQQQIELQLRMPVEEVRVNGDQQRLYQVLTNLLNNALRHTPSKGSIRVLLRLKTKTLELEIGDSGPGFTPEAMNRAFERFYRSADRGRQRGGSGLGLAICRSLVEAHGGSIELIPSQVGACVQISLNKIS
jgi:signal transduction histidine kinase